MNHGPGPHRKTLAILAAVALGTGAAPALGAAPDTTITSGPSGPSASRRASFSFTSPVAGASFTCRLDGGSWRACTSPRSYAGLTQGVHTFSVRARKGPVVDRTPATRRFSVDTVPPQTRITGGPPSATLDIGPEIEFRSSEKRSTFTCSVDGPPWNGQTIDCSSPWLVMSLLYREPYTVRVTARDRAGNIDPTPAARSFTIEPIVLAGGPYAQAAAELYLPDSMDLDVPAACGTGGRDCAGDTPRAPSKQLHIETVALTVIATGQPRWDVRATLSVESLAAFDAHIPLVGTCQVTLDSSQGSSPAWTITLSMLFSYAPNGDVHIARSNLTMAGLEDEDWTLTGSIPCALTTALSQVEDAVLATLEARWQSLGVPLCEKPAPRLVGRCPG